MPEADEPTDNFVKGERWTVRPIFGILVGIGRGGLVVFHFSQTLSFVGRVLSWYPAEFIGP